MGAARPDAPTLLAGWGRAEPSAARLVDVDAAHVAAALAMLDGRGAIARGLGRSYGDPAQNGGGHVLRVTERDVALDAAAGTVTAGAGASLDELIRQLVPRGWFVPVTPGTRFVTVGGAIASDIHGKNHHRDGSFGNHVTRLRLALADASVVEVGPDRDPELFWATVGGMGLTGLILDATFRLIPIETGRITVETRRLGDLDELMARLVDADATARYSVAWLDMLATGRHLGRGVLSVGDHTRRAELDRGAAAAPLAYDGRQVATLPPVVPPPGVINRATVAAFNELWFRTAPRHRTGELQPIPAFFHPLDGVGAWNRAYGRHGFVQYQFVVPDGAEATLRSVIGQIVAARLPIFLTVLKRFGRGNPAPLSFPRPGWTLAVDVPARPALAALLHALDDEVLAAGGRHYLAKDFHTTPDAIRRGYPRLAEWQAVRARADPRRVWQSDQARRLDLI